MANRLFWRYFFRGNPPALLFFPTFCIWKSIPSSPMPDMLNPVSIIEVLCFDSHYRLRGIRAGWDIAFPHIKKARRWDGHQPFNIYVFT